MAVVRDRALENEGDQLNPYEDPRVFVATSTNNGWSYTFNWTWDAARNQYKGVLDNAYATYRFGVVTSNGYGTLIQYATSNADNYLWRLTSTDGINWSPTNNVGFWGFGPSDVKFDAVKGYYMMTLDPPTWISNSCSIPSWKYPLLVLSQDGVTFTPPSVEHALLGQFSLSAEAAILGDQNGRITSGTPLLAYMNTQESSQYNQAGSMNGLFVIDWRRGSGTYCPYP